MTERKWTPGPWSAMDGGWVEAGDGDPIAMINDNGLSNSTFKEDVPNAHLIATAPDLYEALLELRKWMGPCGIDHEIDAAMSAADAAIAKARGEQ